MVDILDSHMVYHQTEYGNGFLMSENIEKSCFIQVYIMFIKKDMDIYKFLRPTVAAILDFAILRH